VYLNFLYLFTVYDLLSLPHLLIDCCAYLFVPCLCFVFIFMPFTFSLILYPFLFLCPLNYFSFTPHTFCLKPRRHIHTVSMAQQPQWAWAYSLLRCHDHTQTRYPRRDPSGRVIGPSQRPVPDNTQHPQQTDIPAPGGIRTHNTSKRAAADPRHRPRGDWDRLGVIHSHYGRIALCLFRCENGRGGR